MAVGPSVAVERADAPLPEQKTSISDQTVAALQRLVGIRYRAARKSFLFNDDFAGTSDDQNPFSVAVRGWRRQLSRCNDNQCRYTQLSAQLARLNFSLGMAPAPVPGMPLRTGTLDMSERGISGGISILPVGDGSVVVAITTSYGGRGKMGTGAWDCAGLVAIGKLLPSGPARMALYDEDKPVAFDLRIVSPTSVRLSENAENARAAAADEDWPAVCSVGTIFGTYHGAPIRRHR
ncbi:hypothetical protein ABC974_18105 [Sphingomonas oligophenolica]|uniref:Uncharacterized protein n=1 Tax=Sphingomonas oligophenolica TaxID=301154 RepID=A0ABU9Y6W4_9SPHN